MPFRHYECPSNHITEQLDPVTHVGKKVYTLEEVLESRANAKTRTIKCSTCNLKAEEVYLPPKQQRDARNFSPTLFYVHPNGDVIVPGRNDPNHLPKRYRNNLAKQGYEQREISNFREYESFQKEQRAKNNHHKQQRDFYVNHTQNTYNANLEKEIQALRDGKPIEVPNPDGTTRTITPPPLDQMSPKMRDLAIHAIEQAKQYRLNKPISDPIVASLEYDGKLPNSDVDSYRYRDSDTDWRSRRS